MWKYVFTKYVTLSKIKFFTPVAFMLFVLHSCRTLAASISLVCPRVTRLWHAFCKIDYNRVQNILRKTSLPPISMLLVCVWTTWVWIIPANFHSIWSHWIGGRVGSMKMCIKYFIHDCLEIFWTSKFFSRLCLITSFFGKKVEKISKVNSVSNILPKYKFLAASILFRVALTLSAPWGTKSWSSFYINLPLILIWTYGQ